LRARHWLWPLILTFPVTQSSAVTIVASRDDARECYLATLAEPTSSALRLGLEACNRAADGQMDDAYLHAAILVNRSDIRLQMHDFFGALADAEASIALEPNVAASYVNRGAALVGLARYSEALSVLDKAITLGAGNKAQMAYYDRGLARDYLGDMRGAYFDYKKTIDIDPEFTPAKEQLARFTVTVKSN